MQSAEEIIRSVTSEPDAGMRIKAVGSAPPPLVVEMPGGAPVTYQVRQVSAEDLLAARRRYEGLSIGDDSALDPGTWVALLSTFLTRADAQRLFREQTLGTVRAALVALTKHATKDIEAS